MLAWALLSSGDASTVPLTDEFIAYFVVSVDWCEPLSVSKKIMVSEPDQRRRVMSHPSLRGQNPK